MTDFNPRPPKVVCACCTKPDDNMHLITPTTGDSSGSLPCCPLCWETHPHKGDFTFAEMPSPEPDHIVTLWSHQ